MAEVKSEQIHLTPPSLATMLLLSTAPPPRNTAKSKSWLSLQRLHMGGEEREEKHTHHTAVWGNCIRRQTLTSNSLGVISEDGRLGTELQNEEQCGRWEVLWRAGSKACRVSKSLTSSLHPSHHQTASLMESPMKEALELVFIFQNISKGPLSLSYI